MVLFLRRKEDKNVLKYWLPYGYMRRHLARVYGYRVVNGDFVKVRIESHDVSGFHLADLLPLGIVMAWQRSHRQKSASVGLSKEQRQIQALAKDLRILQDAFNRYCQQTDAEVERLSVECMRMELALGKQR